MIFEETSRIIKQRGQYVVPDRNHPSSISITSKNIHLKDLRGHKGTCAWQESYNERLKILNVVWHILKYALVRHAVCFHPRDKLRTLSSIILTASRTSNNGALYILYQGLTNPITLHTVRFIVLRDSYKSTAFITTLAIIARSTISGILDGQN